MEKTFLSQFSRIVHGPRGSCRLEKIKSANDVRADKYLRSHDTAVHMGFSGKIDHPGYVKFVKDITNNFFLGNISFYEPITLRMAFYHIRQIGQIPSIGELVNVDNSHLLPFLKDVPHKIGAYKPATSGNQDFRRFLET